MLAALTNRSPVTGDALPRAARLHAVAGHERHLFGELSRSWWSAPFAINILLFTTEIKQFIPFSPPGNCSYELKITFCVRGVISPLLSNILLTPFDREMRRKGYQLTRFADDWVVTCKSAGEARAAIAVAFRILNELGVQLHPQKRRVVHVQRGFEFLGYLIRRGKQLQLPPSKIVTGAKSRGLYAYPRGKSIQRF